jgi:anti-sigma B factor antagonist
MTNEQIRFNSIDKKFLNLNGEHLTLKKDDVLYSENDSADSIFLLLDGVIELRSRKENIITLSRKIMKDEFFGIVDVLKNEGRSDNAIVMEDSEILKIVLTDYDKKQTATNQKKIVKLASSNNASMSLSKSGALKNLFGIYVFRDKKVISFYGQRGNLSNAIVFKNALFSFIDEGNKNIIVDLLSCKTIDSTFLGGLIAALKKITAIGGNLKLVCDENLCSWLFVMTKMDRVFKIYNTVEEAISDWI